ncbi:hypothetical protein, conserved [Leishmania tarentolae]|uniref:Uncharacterized protein n=1 Tax=Leishmania tarentolae TaxID=5689 RepID=A0A640KD30_LEITA|nr:hypothetical protein, conserved [Leishmania tarentolae]
MSRLPHFRSDSDVHRDEESSQSMSQVQARPAIRLDTSLSFISTTSIRAGTTSGPASPLLTTLGGDSIHDIWSSGATVSSPTLFHTRDVNVEASGQHRLQSLKASRSRAVSDSRSACSFSKPFSQPPPPPSQPQHQPFSRSLLPCSPSLRRDYGVHSQPEHGEQAHCLAPEEDGDKLKILESEATVMIRPSDPRPCGSDADGEPDVRSQRVMSATVSPAPRHAVTLPNDFEDVVSMPLSEEAVRCDAEASKGGGSNYATHDDGFGKLSFDNNTQEGDTEDDARGMPSATPPPRRAFVLSRRYSSTDMESDVRVDDEQPPRTVVEEAKRCTPTRMAHADFAADAPRGSTILVMDNEDEDDEFAFTGVQSTAAVITRANAHLPTTTHAPLAEGPSVSPMPPDGHLVAEVVVEKTEKDAQHHAALSTHRAFAADRDSLSNHSGSLSRGDSDMMSPLPRPVPHTAQDTSASKKPSPAHAREEGCKEGPEVLRAVCGDAGRATEQQKQQRADTTAILADKSAGATVNTTTATTATATSTLPVSSTFASERQATSRIPTELDAETSFLSAADGDPVRGTPLNSFMALNSTAGPSLSATATATSSLWLVSGSTPTPLRRLRHGDREVSVTLRTQEGDADDTCRGIGAARTQGARAPTLAGEASATAAETAPDTVMELHESTHQLSVPAVNSREREQPIATVEGAHQHCSSSVPQFNAAHAAVSPTISAPSFSPEPARPQADACRLSWPPVAAGTDASPSVQLNFLAANDNTVGLVDLRSVPAPEATTTQRRYSIAIPPPFATASTLRRPSETALSISLPSSAESARVSEEVKELVRRAQAEVCRTRESLLSALREHRASFHLSETSPTATNRPSATATTPSAQLAAVSTTTCAPLSVSPTPTRIFPPSVVSMVAAEQSTPPSAALKTASVHTTRTLGELQSAATALRPQLRAAADAILRRLQGYDARDHGVLAMETVVRVTYFVLTRRYMPAPTWSLRTAEGALAATPMRASMVASGGGAATRFDGTHPLPHSVEGRRAVLLSGTPLGRHLRSSEAGEPRHRVAGTSSKLCETPPQQRLSFDADVTTKRGGGIGSPFPSSQLIGVTRPRDCNPLDADTADEDKHANPECCGRKATCISPSRTLERVMMLQQRRAEEEQYLQFYLTILEVFKQVFGERYAWRHLGATNASRHDCTIDVAKPAQKRRRTSSVAPSECSDLRSQAHATATEADAETTQLDVVNELNDVTGPLETLFPRLRQQYALVQRDKRDAAVPARKPAVVNTADLPTLPRTSSESALTEAAAAAVGLTHRPPPLDVLVYYRTFIESLREL